MRGAPAPHAPDPPPSSVVHNARALVDVALAAKRMLPDAALMDRLKRCAEMAAAGLDVPYEQGDAMPVAETATDESHDGDKSMEGQWMTHTIARACAVIEAAAAGAALPRGSTALVGDFREYARLLQLLPLDDDRRVNDPPGSDPPAEVSADAAASLDAALQRYDGRVEAEIAALSALDPAAHAPAGCPVPLNPTSGIDRPFATLDWLASTTAENSPTRFTNGQLRSLLVKMRYRLKLLRGEVARGSRWAALACRQNLQADVVVDLAIAVFVYTVNAKWCDCEAFDECQRRRSQGRKEGKGREQDHVTRPRPPLAHMVPVYGPKGTHSLIMNWLLRAAADPSMPGDAAVEVRRGCAFFAPLQERISRGLAFLPATSGVRFRGVDVPLARSWRVGSKVCFTAFTSAALSCDVATMFLDNGQRGTLFVLETRSAKQLDDLSHYPGQNEAVLDVGTWLEVTGLVEGSREGSFDLVFMREVERSLNELFDDATAASELHAFLADPGFPDALRRRCAAYAPAAIRWWRQGGPQQDVWRRVFELCMGIPPGGEAPPTGPPAVLYDAPTRPVSYSHLTADVTGVLKELTECLDDNAVHAVFNDGGDGDGGAGEAVDKWGLVHVGSTARNLKALREMLESPAPLLVEGDTGIGKNALLDAVVKMQNAAAGPAPKKDLYRMNLSAGTSVGDLFGKMCLTREGMMRFDRRPFSIAFEEGHIIVLDECNLAQEEVLSVLEIALDTGVLTIWDPAQPARAARQLRRHPDFRVVITQNPCTGLFAQKRTQFSRAFLSRFMPVPLVPFEPHELEAVAATRLQDAIPAAIREMLGQRLVAIHRGVARFAAEEGHVSSATVFTVRDLLYAVQILNGLDVPACMGGDGEEAAILNKLLSVAWCIYGARFARGDEQKAVAKTIGKCAVLGAAGEPAPHDLTPESLIARIPQRVDVPPEGAPVAVPLLQGALHPHPIVMTLRMAQAWRQCAFAMGPAAAPSRPVILLGMPGTGTTACALAFAAHHAPAETDVKVVHMTAETRDADLVGQLVAAVAAGDGGDGDTGELIRWQSGPVTSAMETGSWLVLDDLTAAAPTVLERINCVLEETPTLYLDDHPGGGAVRAKPGFFVLATARVDLLGRLSPALLNRFALVGFPSGTEAEANEERALMVRGMTKELATPRKASPRGKLPVSPPPPLVGLSGTHRSTGVAEPCAPDPRPWRGHLHPVVPPDPVAMLDEEMDFAARFEHAPGATQFERSRAVTLAYRMKAIESLLASPPPAGPPPLQSEGAVAKPRAVTMTFTEPAERTSLAGDEPAAPSTPPQAVDDAAIVAALGPSSSMADTVRVMLCASVDSPVSPVSVRRAAALLTEDEFERRQSISVAGSGAGAARDRRESVASALAGRVQKRIDHCRAQHLPFLIIDSYRWNLPLDGAVAVVASPHSTPLDWLGTTTPEYAEGAQGDIRLVRKAGPLRVALDEGRIFFVDGVDRMDSVAQEQLCTLLRYGLVGQEPVGPMQRGFCVAARTSVLNRHKVDPKLQAQLIAINLPPPAVRDYLEAMKSVEVDMASQAGAATPLEDRDAIAGFAEQLQVEGQVPGTALPAAVALDLSVFRRVCRRALVLRPSDAAAVPSGVEDGRGFGLRWWAIVYAGLVRDACRDHDEWAEAKDVVESVLAAVTKPAAANGGIDISVVADEEAQVFAADDGGLVTFVRQGIRADLRGALGERWGKYAPLGPFVRAVVAVAHHVAVGEALVLAGPTGCKTAAVEAFLAITAPDETLEPVHMTCATDAMDLLGSHHPYPEQQLRDDVTTERIVLKQRAQRGSTGTDAWAAWLDRREQSCRGAAGQTVFAFRDGPLTRLVKRGLPILIKNADLPLPALWESLAAFLEGGALDTAIATADGAAVPRTRAAALILTVLCGGEAPLPRTLASISVVRCAAYRNEDLTALLATEIRGSSTEAASPRGAPPAAPALARGLLCLYDSGLRMLLRGAAFIRTYSKVASVPRHVACVLGMTFLSNNEFTADHERELQTDAGWGGDFVAEARRAIPAFVQESNAACSFRREFLEYEEAGGEGGQVVVAFGAGAGAARKVWVKAGCAPGGIPQASADLEMVPTETLLRTLASILAASALSVPLLLEGPPGVGKSFAVIQAASVVGAELVRVQFSAGTTAALLYGSLLPTVDKEGRRVLTRRPGAIGEAVQKAEAGTLVWLLLEELNLAPLDVQQRIAGLLTRTCPACPFYLPHLRVFAATNPAVVGSGRSHLPPSVKTLFAALSVQPLTIAEQMTVARAKFTALMGSSAGIAALTPPMTTAITDVHRHAVDALASASDAATAAPINLRTLEKVLMLLATRLGASAGPAVRIDLEGDGGAAQAAAFFFQVLDVVYAWGVPDPDGRAAARRIISAAHEKFYKETPDVAAIPPPSLTTWCLAHDSTVSFGAAVLPRGGRAAAPQAPLHVSASLRERMLAAATASAASLAVLLQGESGCGKTALVREMARICGQPLQIITANPSTEVGDLLGSWVPWSAHAFKNDATSAAVVEEAVKLCSTAVLDAPQLADPLRELLERRSLPAARAACEAAAAAGDGCVFVRPAKRLLNLLRAAGASVSGTEGVTFHYAESALLHAIRYGEWVLIDNVDWMPVATLERLNSLLEATPTITVHERGEPNEPVLRYGCGIHPNFKLFFTANPARAHAAPLTSPFLNRVIRVCLDGLAGDDGQGSIASVVSRVLPHAFTPAERSLWQALATTFAAHFSRRALGRDGSAPVCIRTMTHALEHWRREATSRSASAREALRMLCRRLLKIHRSKDEAGVAARALRDALTEIQRVLEADARPAPGEGNAALRPKPEGGGEKEAPRAPGTEGGPREDKVTPAPEAPPARAEEPIEKEASVGEVPDMPEYEAESLGDDERGDDYKDESGDADPSWLFSDAAGVDNDDEGPAATTQDQEIMSTPGDPTLLRTPQGTDNELVYSLMTRPAKQGVLQALGQGTSSLLRNVCAPVLEMKFDKNAPKRLSRFIIREWGQQDIDVADELCRNLKAPSGVGDQAKLQILCELCKQTRAKAEKAGGKGLEKLNDIQLLCIVLNTMEGSNLDVLMGFQDVPKWDINGTAEEQQKWRAYKEEFTATGKRNRAIYSLVNSALRQMAEGGSDEARESLVPWVKYVGVLLSLGGHRVKKADQVVYRGVQVPASLLAEWQAQAAEDDEGGGRIWWWANAASSTYDGMVPLAFLAPVPSTPPSPNDRTKLGNVVFNIEDVTHGVELEAISEYPEEREFLLPPFVELEMAGAEEEACVDKGKEYRYLEIKLRFKQRTIFTRDHEDFCRGLHEDMDRAAVKLRAAYDGVDAVPALTRLPNATPLFPDAWVEAPPPMMTAPSLAAYATSGSALDASGTLSAPPPVADAVEAGNEHCRAFAGGVAPESVAAAARVGWLSHTQAAPGVVEAVDALLPMNVFTRMAASASGSEIYIPGLIRAVATNFAYSKVFGAKTAGGARSYSAVVLLDAACAPPSAPLAATWVYLNLFKTLRNALRAVSVPCAVLVHSAGAPAVTHCVFSAAEAAGMDAWTDCSTAALLTALHALGEKAKAAGAGEPRGAGLHLAVSTALKMRGKHRAVFYITPGTLKGAVPASVQGALALAHTYGVDVLSVGLSAAVHNVTPNAVSLSCPAALGIGLSRYLTGPHHAPDSDELATALMAKGDTAQEWEPWSTALAHELSGTAALHCHARYVGDCADAIYSTKTGEAWRIAASGCALAPRTASPCEWRVALDAYADAYVGVVECRADGSGARLFHARAGPSGAGALYRAPAGDASATYRVRVQRGSVSVFDAASPEPVWTYDIPAECPAVRPAVAWLQRAVPFRMRVRGVAGFKYGGVASRDIVRGVWQRWCRRDPAAPPECPAAPRAASAALDVVFPAGFSKAVQGPYAVQGHVPYVVAAAGASYTGAQAVVVESAAVGGRGGTPFDGRDMAANGRIVSIILHTGIRPSSPSMGSLLVGITVCYGDEDGKNGGRAHYGGRGEPLEYVLEAGEVITSVAVECTRYIGGLRFMTSKGRSHEAGPKASSEWVDVDLEGGQLCYISGRAGGVVDDIGEGVDALRFGYRVGAPSAAVAPSFGTPLAKPSGSEWVWARPGAADALTELRRPNPRPAAAVPWVYAPAWAAGKPQPAPVPPGTVGWCVGSAAWVRDADGAKRALPAAEGLALWTVARGVLDARADKGGVLSNEYEQFAHRVGHMAHGLAQAGGTLPQAVATALLFAAPGVDRLLPPERRLAQMGDAMAHDEAAKGLRVGHTGIPGSEAQYASAVVAYPFDSGVHEWQVTVEGGTENAIVGVCDSAAFDPNESALKQRAVGYFGARGQLYLWDKVVDAVEGFAAGDVVTVTVDVGGGTVTFHKNTTTKVGQFDMKDLDLNARSALRPFVELGMGGSAAEIAFRPRKSDSAGRLRAAVDDLCELQLQERRPGNAIPEARRRTTLLLYAAFASDKAALAQWLKCDPDAPALHATGRRGHPALVRFVIEQLEAKKPAADGGDDGEAAAASAGLEADAAAALAMLDRDAPADTQFASRGAFLKWFKLVCRQAFASSEGGGEGAPGAVYTGAVVPAAVAGRRVTEEEFGDALWAEAAHEPPRLRKRNGNGRWLFKHEWDGGAAEWDAAPFDTGLPAVRGDVGDATRNLLKPMQYGGYQRVEDSTQVLQLFSLPWLCLHGALMGEGDVHAEEDAFLYFVVENPSEANEISHLQLVAGASYALPDVTLWQAERRLDGDAALTREQFRERYASDDHAQWRAAAPPTGTDARYPGLRIAPEATALVLVLSGRVRCAQVREMLAGRVDVDGGNDVMLPALSQFTVTDAPSRSEDGRVLYVPLTHVGSVFQTNVSLNRYVRRVAGFWALEGEACFDDAGSEKGFRAMPVEMWRRDKALQTEGVEWRAERKHTEGDASFTTHVFFGRELQRNPSQNVQVEFADECLTFVKNSTAFDPKYGVGTQGKTYSWKACGDKGKPALPLGYRPAVALLSQLGRAADAAGSADGDLVQVPYIDVDAAAALRRRPLEDAVTISAGTIEAAAAAHEAAVQPYDPVCSAGGFDDFKARMKDAGIEQLPPPAAHEVFGTNVYDMTVGECAAFHDSVAINTSSRMPPAFCQSLTRLTWRREFRTFWGTLKGVPLNDIAKDWTRVCEKHLKALRTALENTAAIDDAFSQKRRDKLARLTLELEAVRRNAACLEREQQRVANDEPCAVRELQHWVEMVRENPEESGFHSSSEAELYLNMSLSDIGGEMCVSQSGALFTHTDGDAVAQLISRRAEGGAAPLTFLLSPCRVNFLDDGASKEKGRYLVAGPGGSCHAFKPNGAMELKCRFREMYRSLYRAAKGKGVRHMSMVPSGWGMYLGRGTKSMTGDMKKRIKTLYLEAQIELLCEADWGFECYWLVIGDPADMQLATEVLNRGLRPMGVYNNAAAGMQLRCNIVLHQKDAKAMASTLSRAGKAASYFVPSSTLCATLGCVGSDWETARDWNYAVEQDLASTSTCLLASIAIMNASNGGDGDRNLFA